MTAIMGLLTFLAVVAFGIALAIGTGVVRWNSQWDLTATVQIMNPDNAADVKKIIDENGDKIKSSTEITTDEMRDLLRPWLSGGGGALENYLPKMYEIQFNSADGIAQFHIGRVENDIYIGVRVAVNVGRNWRMHFVHRTKHSIITQTRIGNIKSNRCNGLVRRAPNADNHCKNLHRRMQCWIRCRGTCIVINPGCGTQCACWPDGNVGNFWLGLVCAVFVACGDYNFRDMDNKTHNCKYIKE